MSRTRARRSSLAFRAFAFLALAALLSPLAAVAAQGADADANPGRAPVAVTFDAPAQTNGTHRATGSGWMLLVFGSGPAGLDLDLPAGATLENHTLLVTSGSGPVQGGSPRGDWPPVPANVPAGTLHLAFRAGRWGSLYLEADALSWSAAGGALLVPSEAGDAPGRFLQDVFPAGTVRPALAVPAAGVAAAFRPDPQAPLSLRAEGVRRAEWHNATVSCSAGLAPCPDGAGTATLAAAPSSPAGGFSLSAASFANLLPGGSAGGRLAGSGAAFLWAAGGPALDLAVDGQVRLPAAILAGSCAACGQEARTFRAAGELTLAPLGRDPSGSGRLQARLGGAVAAAALDETALPFPAAAGAAALGAIALAAVAVKLVLVLAARRRASARDHPRRRALLELILESPGLTLREIQRRTGWGNGATRHHLDKLRRGNHIVAHADGNTVRHFENHGRFDRTWRQVVRERDPELGPLLEWLRLHPGSSQVRVQEAAAAWGWSRSGTQRRLASLQRSGLVTAARSGRSLAYTAAPMSGTGGQGPAAASAQA